MLDKVPGLPFRQIIKHKSIQNFIFLAVIQASNILISLISMPLLISSIGVDQFGLVNLALSVIMLGNILVGFGYNLSGPRDVAIHHKDKVMLSHLVSNIIYSKVMMAAVAALIIFIAIIGFDFFEEYQMILAFSVLLLFSEAIMPLWFFQGLEKMKLISIANVFSKLLFLMGIVLFIHSPEASIWVNFLLGGTALSVNILLLVYIHYEMEILFYKPKFFQIYFSLKRNVLLLLSNFATHISINSGLIILSFFSAAEDLGMYSLAERIVMILRIFPSLIVQAIYPNAARKHQEGIHSFINFARKIYGWSILLGFVISLVTYFIAPFIVFFLSKSDLPPAVMYLKILSFIPFLACLNIANILMLLVTDQKDLLFKSSWITCLYMLGSSLILTDKFGTVGLCYALLSTEIIVFIISTIILYTKHSVITFRLYNFK
ncbi:oligosaccharide flippase family protein [Anditalea andensis]|uniref:Polysaccharide biosynthesis protein n=1 Tax=Anditalea andensis TaxID=1048983 RepID=A0A074KUK0_9BACT|nr:oligosaccharide flippase family protein [Anditalea andensis]KEO73626.1 polysaccharide biosynthesis protein [Anditalea andensis]